MDDIVWTENALQDLDDIAAYIALDNLTAAANVVRRIVEAVAGLSFSRASDGQAAPPAPGK